MAMLSIALYVEKKSGFEKLLYCYEVSQIAMRMVSLSCTSKVQHTK